MNRQNHGMQPMAQDDGVSASDHSVDYREMINRHLKLIERQCYKVVRQQLKAAGYSNPDAANPVNIENEVLELSSSVIDTLQKDDYQVLRRFKGNSKLSTYITTIVARHAVDMIRKKRGRDRQRDRAKTLGTHGMAVYDLIFTQGCSMNEALTRLSQEQGIDLPLEEIQRMSDIIRGKQFAAPSNPVVKEAMIIRDDKKETFIIPDNQSEPAVMWEEKERVQMLDDVVKGMVKDLNGEERLILRMRFPTSDDSKPAKISAIARALGITEKATYKRITRILKKCRDILEKKGVAIDDLL